MSSASTSQTHDDDIVIVDAVRSPVGRRGGDLSGIHPSDLLSDVLTSTRHSHRSCSRGGAR